MKYLCFIVCIALPLTLSGQQQDSSKFHSGAKETSKEERSGTTARRTDTTKATLKDSVTLLHSRPADSIKIILAKSEEEKDSTFFKYWFPLITLLIGSAITLLSEFVRSWFITRRAGKRWIGQAKLYLPIIQNQESLIKEFLRLEDPEKWGIVALNRASHIEGDQFNAFSEEELLKYLEQHRLISGDKALNLTSRITGTLRSLKLTYQQLDDSYKLYMASISRFSNEATEILRELGQALAGWTASIEENGFMDGEEAAYNNAIQLYQTEILDKIGQDDWNIFELQENLFDPMIEIVAPGFVKPAIKEILMKLAVAKQTVKKIKAEKGYMRQNAETLLERYKEYRKDLHQQIKEIDHAKRSDNIA